MPAYLFAKKDEMSDLKYCYKVDEMKQCLYQFVKNYFLNMSMVHGQ